MPKSEHEAYCEPSSAKERVKYRITTKDGTIVEKFERFIKKLPDGGKYEDRKMVWEDKQSYVTYLTYDEAKKVAQNDFIDYVILARPAIMKFNMDQGIYDQTDLDMRLTDTQLPHLGIISSPRGTLEDRSDGNWPAYEYDPTLGKDQTIYVVDTGFTTVHEEFVGSRTRTYVVKNSITLQDVDQKLWPPENDHTDYDGHGTMVASVAAGQRYGVASNAHLVLVKVAQTHWDTHKAEKRGMVIPKDDVIVHPQAMQTAWDWIVEDVLAKRRQGATGKAIVCMSASLDIPPLPPMSGQARHLFIDVFKRAFEKCWAHDIITVISAGNYGEQGKSLDMSTPQNIGTKDNALITVGGVNIRGALWTDTAFDRGIRGSITVYAVAENVPGAYYKSSTKRARRNGTSLAAPAVAGLCAYFAGLPSLAHKWRPGSVAIDMKRYIAGHALQRARYPVPSPLPQAYQGAALQLNGSTIKVAYNRVYDGLSSWNTPDGESDSLDREINTGVGGPSRDEAVSTSRTSSERDGGRERRGNPGKRAEALSTSRGNSSERGEGRERRGNPGKQRSP